ncbi:MAG: hypothetical protein KC496_17445 [Anaerolineae bacterium]|nr:hypothetical protein [Anaerolineae bacterium]
MNYSIEILNDPRVMHVTMHEGFQQEDFADHVRDVWRTLDSLEEPLYQIIDIRGVELSFDDVMEFLRVAVRGEHPLPSHPMNRGNLVVTDSRLYQLVIKGLRTASFGNISIHAYESLDAALHWVYRQAA